MERLIKGLMNAIMKVAIVLVILFIFIAGMAGIYRLGNISWKKHFMGWAFFLIAFWIIDFSEPIIAQVWIILIVSLSSKCLVYLFNRFEIYETFNDDSTIIDEDTKSKEWFFGLFTSPLILVFIILGALIWDSGVDPLNNDGLEVSISSLIGYLLLTIGIGLPFLGFVFRFIISEKEEV